ncbi:hypothetical protein MNBD_BACTEROID03-552 [hydrothermal vent metagenome]|uniref:Uncharacterized protein n=1 Tax=hydrothermal vent metagenome TaxID=652676 RepID=A0A3B0TLN4_9ZZZZ
MKTINHLLVIALLVFTSSCSYEDLWPSNTEDGSDEEQVVHLELDLHQLALEAEEKREFREYQIIFEKFKNGDEGQEIELKKSEHRLLENLDAFLENEELFRRIGRRPRRPPGNPCGNEGPEIFSFMTEFALNREEYLSNPSGVYSSPDFFNCPIRMLDNVKILVHKNQDEVQSIEFFTTEGEVYGEMVGLEPTGEEGFQEAIVEREEGFGGFVKVTKKNHYGELIAYSLPIEN